MPGDYRANTAVQFHSRQADRFESFYDQLAVSPYGASFVYTRRRLDSLLRRFIPERAEGLKLLDVGCGTGHYMTTLARRGFEVSGVDGSAEMLERARVNNPSADVRQGDVESLPFESESFDYVISIEVLRYLPTSQGCIQEMARVLKPGGVCLATAMPLFNANGYWFVNRLANVVKPRSLSHLKQYFITSGQLRRQFSDAGFVGPDVHGVYSGPINWVERLAPRLFPSFLRIWEHVDIAIADRSLLREFSNLFLVHAVRGGGPLSVQRDGFGT